MQKHFLYSEVVAPAPPEWLIQQGKLAKANNEAVLSQRRGWGESLTARNLTRNGETFPNAYLASNLLDENAQKWATTEVVPGSAINDIRFTHTPDNGRSSGPHRDVTRNYPMIFLLSAGGENSRTVWYKERSGAELAIKNSNLAAPHEYGLVRIINDYSEIEEIASVVIPVGVWFIINATILHSVEDIPHSRQSIQISLNEFPENLTLVNPVYYTEG